MNFLQKINLPIYERSLTVTFGVCIYALVLFAMHKSTPSLSEALFYDLALAMGSIFSIAIILIGILDTRKHGNLNSNAHDLPSIVLFTIPSVPIYVLLLFVERVKNE
jgi:hypothetical protein